MAKSKRPQTSVHAAGVPTAQIQTGVNPVDTFVNPGLVGMPQQKEGTVAPNQPDMQKARDLQALGQAFQGLSSSLGEYGMSEARLDNKIEEWGREQAGLDSAQRITGQKMAVAADAKWIDYIDHPRFQSGRSEARMGIAVNDFHNNIMADLTKHRASNPDLDTIEGSMKWYDSMVQGMAWPKMSRPDVGERTLIKAQSAGRKIFENAQRKYLGEKGVNESLQAIGTTIRNTTRSALSEIIDPSVSMGTNAYGIPVVKAVNPADPADVFQERLAIAGEEITAFIDAQYGGLLTPDLVNEAVGKALVDMALTTDSPEEAMFAVELLKSIKTGPKGARGNLVEISAVEEHYSDKKSLLASRMSSNISKGIVTTFKGNFANMRTGVIQDLQDTIQQMRGAANKNTLIDTFFSDFAETDVITDNNGVTRRKEGNSIKYSVNIDGEEKIIGTLNAESVVEEAMQQNFRQVRTAALKRRTDEVHAQASELLFDGQDEANAFIAQELRHADIEAEVEASIQTNMPSQILKSEFRNALELVDATRSGMVSQEDKLAGMETVERAVHAYSLLVSKENHTSIETHVPDEDTLIFLETLKIMRENEFVASKLTGGNRWEDIYNRITDVTGGLGYKIDNMQKVWDTDNYGVNLIKSHFPEETSYYNRYKLTQDVQNVARVLHLQGGMSIEDAIQSAAISRQERLVTIGANDGFGGYQIDKGDLHPALLDNKIPLTKDGTLPQIYIQSALESIVGKGAKGLYGSIGGIKNLASAVDAILGVSAIFRNEIPTLNDRKSALREALMGAVTDTVQAGMSSWRDITLDEALAAATETFQRKAPKEFAALQQKLGGEVVGLRPVEGSFGLAYQVAIRDPETGIIRRAGKPLEGGREGFYNINDILELGDWTNKKRHAQTLPISERMRYHHQRMGMRHPLNILGGLTGGGVTKETATGWYWPGETKDVFGWDLDRLKKKQSENFTQRQIDNGIRASDLPTGTGGVMQQ